MGKKKRLLMHGILFKETLHAVVHFLMEQVMLETVGQQLTVLHTQSLWMEKHTKCQPHVVIVSKTIQTTQLKIVGWTPILLTVIYQKMKSQADALTNSKTF